ncbi:alpha/beta fold hydrolase [Natronorarus salvus]|uniref:alpha/beta fold hydrolase n=1 Tax=Natronorarus salvus TaxID=3117733 RepID=UPI002F260690
MDRETVAGHPTITVGDGSRTLVVLPGLGDALGPTETPLVVRLVLRRYYRPFTDRYTVHVVSRPRGLGGKTTTREMATGYAKVLAEVGPADVLGVSMGGLIAQHLGAEHSGCVDRLVIAVAAHRLGEEGRRIVERWRELGRGNHWKELYRDTIRVTYEDPRRRAVYGALGRLPPVVPRPEEPEDFLVSVTACLDHDAGDVLSEIDVPTLVIGGDEDPLFPADLIAESAHVIPDATLKLLPGTGHGAFEERKRGFDASVRRFLAE